MEQLKLYVLILGFVMPLLEIGALAQTRSMSKDSKKEVKPLKVFESQFNLYVSLLEFGHQQDESLRTA